MIFPRFSRYVGIDYSGAQTPEASLNGLRVYMASRDQEPIELPPPSGRNLRCSEQTEQANSPTRLQPNLPAS